MTSYRVEYTEVKPGGTHVDQCEKVIGTLEDVRTLLDSRRVYALIAPRVTEFTKSDGDGRFVPASEWDVFDDES